MADVYIPRIERAFQQLHKPRFKACDRAAMALLCVIASSFVMYSAGHAVLSIPVLGFNVSADVNINTSPVPNATRSHRRLAHRVQGVMKANCISRDDVVFASQVTVNGDPYAHSLVFMCNNSRQLINPEVVHIGTSNSQCADENNGVRKVKSRQYPIHVKSGDVVFAYSNLQDACIIWTIIEMLQGSW